MSDLYDVTVEKLRDKLLLHENEINFDINLPCAFPFDELVKLNPNFSIINLVNEVEKEFSYGMSINQCSWAVMNAKFILGKK